MLAGHDRIPRGKGFASGTDDDNDGDGGDDGDAPCRVRITDDRIRDGERRARRPGHRTRWPGHCAGTEATPQPRPPGTPSSSLSPAVPLLFYPSRSPLPSLAFCNTLPPPPRIALPSSRRYSRALSRAAMVGKFGEPSWRVCTSFPLFCFSSSFLQARVSFGQSKRILFCSF